jgi:hypothetical protein
MIKLLTAENESHAIHIKAILESGGLKVAMSTSNQSFLPGTIGVNNGIVPYDIYIRESDLTKAKELLKEN